MYVRSPEAEVQIIGCYIFLVVTNEFIVRGQIVSPHLEIDTSTDRLAIAIYIYIYSARKCNCAFFNFSLLFLLELAMSTVRAVKRMRGKPCCDCVSIRTRT